jgi:hypothetical protein
MNTDVDLARTEHALRHRALVQTSHATRTSAATRWQHRADRLARRAERVARRADRASSRARLVLG